MALELHVLRVHLDVASRSALAAGAFTEAGAERAGACAPPLGLQRRNAALSGRHGAAAVLAWSAYLLKENAPMPVPAPQPIPPMQPPPPGKLPPLDSPPTQPPHPTWVPEPPVVDPPTGPGELPVVDPPPGGPQTPPVVDPPPSYH